jgi:hypothetical protein
MAHRRRHRHDRARNDTSYSSFRKLNSPHRIKLETVDLEKGGLHRRLVERAGDPVRRGRRSAGRRVAGVVTSCIAIGWLLRPVPGQIDLSTCSPEGLVANFDANLPGPYFWRIQRSEFQDQVRREQAEVVGKARAQIEEAYQRAAQTAPSDAQREAEVLRARADAIEASVDEQVERDHFERIIPLLARCEKFSISQIDVIEPADDDSERDTLKRAGFSDNETADYFESKKKKP